MILTTCVYALGISVGACMCSFLEWLVHGPFMHGGLATAFLRSTHINHHSPVKYRSDEHNVRLPWWAPVAMIGPIAFITAAGSWFIGRWEIATTSVATAICYFIIYQYIHRCLHEKVDGPERRWIKNTKWFVRRDLIHRIHHAHEKDFDRPVNLGILTSFWDRFIGTYQGSDSTKKKEVVC